MGTIGSTWASIQGPVAGLRRVHSVLDNLGEPTGARLPENGAPKLDHRIGTLEFRDVAIGYGATTVLSGVSMALKAGELVALAGPSGCGKTTLIYSIPRFLEPSSGAIEFDGTDSRSLAPDAIRERVGFVFQQESLFSISIDDNIRYGCPSRTEAQVREAADMAGAAAFIEDLPDRYATILGRRIAIARALLRRPEIMVLDEPTAPLDPGSESDLIKTLRDLARDRIVIIVAHRTDTLAACDRILFVHNGTIAASGTHDNLLASCPPYRAYLAHTASEIQA
jgi:ATP-binding cassette subfamily B protein